MSDILDRRLGQLDDGDVRFLLADLEELSGVPLADFESMSLFSYFSQCVYPGGRERERLQIDGRFLAGESVLDAELGAIAGTPVYAICDALLRRKRSSAEFWHEETVATVLNEAIPFATRRSSAEEDAADADVVRQRRRNR